jgi:signal transduction histidine kinase
MLRLFRSPAVLTCAMLLPLGVMAVLSWVGMRAQVRAAWVSAREEVQELRFAVAVDLAEELEKSLMPAQIFPDPPMPGTASPKDEILNGTDLAALRALRDDREAGLSSAGLPRQVLAGFRVMELGGDGNDGHRLLKLAMADAPSVLSSLAVEKYGGEIFIEAWKQEDAARALFRKFPDVGSKGLWTADAEVVWLRNEGALLRCLPANLLEEGRKSALARLPKWAGLRLVAGGHFYGDASGEVLQSIRVPFAEDLRMEIVAAKPEWIDAEARRQGRWSMAVLGCALLVCGAAVIMMQHALRRERQLSEMKSQFVASVSHELRAPVASIRLMAEGLEAGKVESGMVGDFHRLIARESARLSTLVMNVLDHSRIEQGKKIWRMKLYDVSALCEESISVMKPLAQEKGIVLEADLVAVKAVVDADAVQQALVNLLDNAIKFSPKNTTVLVKLLLRENSVEVSVADSGPGVPDAEKAMIFERFYRSGNELRRETQGTGIGLSLVKSIAEAHGGSVRVETPPRGGSVFIFTIPHKR